MDNILDYIELNVGQQIYNMHVIVFLNYQRIEE